MTWPFSTAELTAGLRRYFAEPTLQVAGLAEQPVAPTLSSSLGVRAVRGLQVTYSVAGSSIATGSSTLACVVKELDSEARPGLANPGVREAGVYRSLSLSCPWPRCVDCRRSAKLACPGGGETPVWPRSWNKDETYSAIQFWPVCTSVSGAWLTTWRPIPAGAPLTIDYEIHVYAAAQALGEVVARGMAAAY